MFFPFYAGPVVPYAPYAPYAPYKPAYGYDFNGFGYGQGPGPGPGFDLGGSAGCESWALSRPAVCSFGSGADSGSGARTGMGTGRDSLEGLMFNQLLEQNASTNSLLAKLLATLNATQEPGGTGVTTDPPPAVRCVEGQDMFRSRTDHGHCSPCKPSPPSVDANTTDLPSVGSGGATPNVSQSVALQPYIEPVLY